MRKIFAAALALSLSLPLTACGSSASPGGVISVGPPASQSGPAKPEAAKPDAPSKDSPAEPEVIAESDGAAEPGWTPIALPASIPEVPSGMKLVRLGGLAVAVPESYVVDESALDYTGVINVDHPAWPEVMDRVGLSYRDNFEPGGERALVQQERSAFTDIAEEGELSGDGYTGYHIQGKASLFGGESYDAEYYLIFKDWELYEAVFLSDGKDPQLKASEETLAFDPSAVFGGGGGSEPEYVYEATEDAAKEDFDWVKYGPPEFPDDAIAFEDITGRWKCSIDYDDIMAYDLNNVTISGTPENAVLTVRWLWMFYNGDEPYDERNDPASDFTGTFRDGVLYVTGPGNIKSRLIYNLYEKQYFIGEITVPSGEVYPFYMVRP